MRSYKAKTLLRYKSLLRRVLLGESTVAVVAESAEDLKALRDLNVLGRVHLYFAPAVLEGVDLCVQEELAKHPDEGVRQMLVRFGDSRIAAKVSRTSPLLRAFFLSREDVPCEQVVREIESINDPHALKTIAQHRASSSAIAAALWKRGNNCSTLSKELGNLSCILLFNAPASFLSVHVEELLRAGAVPFYLFVRDDLPSTLYERATRVLSSDEKLRLLRARNLSTKALEALSKDADPLVSQKAKEKLYRRLRYLERRLDR